ncbi:MAG: ATP-binding cassette domain-containing protein, partial [Candidatus Poseidoniaceae archaeon]|nr:ATP-binding cassette domain-containing protein [Candidatus Poseidoniaceae archaeon]
MVTPLLSIEDIHVDVDGNQVIKGLSMEIRKGEVHAIMGPNASGKSTLSNILSGKKGYEISGEVRFENNNLLKLGIEERA